LFLINHTTFLQQRCSPSYRWRSSFYMWRSSLYV